MAQEFGREAINKALMGIVDGRQPKSRSHCFDPDSQDDWTRMVLIKYKCLLLATFLLMIMKMPVR